MRRLLLTLVLLPAPLAAQSAPSLRSGQALSAPPMGWNSWNKFGCDINEQLIRDVADSMVAKGMKDAGYQYVNIDDCWMAPTRDAQDRLQPDPVRFPHGIKALADYVHAKGMKLGIYSSAGTKTCQDLPASLDHEKADAQSFADWGVDYLKYDNCNNEGRPALARYTAMRDALAATKRPIVFSFCEWGSNRPWLWARSAGAALWRTTGDIEDKWSSVMWILDQQTGLQAFAGPGGWNDPDMLEVGNGGMSAREYRAHFSLWALLNAPLIAGNDIRSMTDTTGAILMNREVIAVDQDWGGSQGYRLTGDGSGEVWAKPMSDGSTAVVLLNRGESSRVIGVTRSQLRLPRGNWRARELWTHADVPLGDALSDVVPAHGAMMYVIGE